jgi:hypothetical protein
MKKSGLGVKKGDKRGPYTKGADSLVGCVCVRVTMEDQAFARANAALVRDKFRLLLRDLTGNSFWA